MTQSEFPPHIRSALDHYSVPPLPAGFAERLLARIEDGVAPSTPALPVARPRRNMGGRWRRSGIVVGSVGLFGMVTAAAAATGIFGDPVYVPVVSEALAQANIAPVAPKKAKPVRPEPTKTIAAVSSVAPANVDRERSADARQMIRDMWQDPEFRRLPKAERRAQAKQALREAMAKGDFTREELTQTLQQLRIERQERRAQRTAARDLIGAGERPAARFRPKHKANAPASEKTAPADTVPAVTDNPAMRPNIQRLRERLQNATPEERALIRAEIRARRAERRAEKAAVDEPDKPLQSPVTEDVAEPPK